jgi:DNA-directed RNA polymerase specialized sigma24 family protein
LGRLSGVTTENVKKLIMRAIEEYRNDRDAPGERITTIT